MKRLFICILFIIAIVFTSTIDYAVDVNTLTLETNGSRIKVNDSINVDINLVNFHQVYAAHVKIIFDTEYLVANTDDIKISEELSTKNYFVALNSVDNNSGTVEFVVTLLGNEKTIEGDFSIGSLSFKCIKSGNTNIRIEYSKFLTSEGNSIKHDAKSLALNIVAEDKSSFEDNDPTESNVSSNNKGLSELSMTEDELLTIQASNIAPINFIDIKSHWAKEYIDILSSMGIINGVNAEEFKPDSFISRCQLAKIIGLAIEQESIELANHISNFADRDNIPNWAVPHVDILVQLGIIRGYNDNTFKPNKEVTRLELAVIVARILKSSDLYDAGTLYTDDADIPNWGKGSVYLIRRLGIINGYNDGSFRPNDPVTRAEVCKVIVLMLDLLED